MSFCKNCGEQHIGGNLFCTKCGTGKSVTPAPAQPQPAKQKSNKPLLIALLSVCGILLIGGGVFAGMLLFGGDDAVEAYDNEDDCEYDYLSRHPMLETLDRLREGFDRLEDDIPYSDPTPTPTYQASHGHPDPSPTATPIPPVPTTQDMREQVVGTWVGEYYNPRSGRTFGVELVINSNFRGRLFFYWVPGSEVIQDFPVYERIDVVFNERDNLFEITYSNPSNLPSGWSESATMLLTLNGDTLSGEFLRTGDPISFTRWDIW